MLKNKISLHFSHGRICQVILLILFWQGISFAIFMPGSPPDTKFNFQPPPAIEPFKINPMPNFPNFMKEFSPPISTDLTKLPQNLDIFGHQINNIKWNEILNRGNQQLIRGIGDNLRFQIEINYRDLSRHEVDHYRISLNYEQGQEIVFLNSGELKGLEDILKESLSIKDVRRITLIVELDEEGNIKLIMEEGRDSQGKSLYRKEAFYKNGDLVKEITKFDQETAFIFVDGERVIGLIIEYGGENEEGEEVDKTITLLGEDSQGKEKELVTVTVFRNGKSKTVTAGAKALGVSTQAIGESKKTTSGGNLLIDTVTGFDLSGNPLYELLYTYASPATGSLLRLMARILSLSSEDEDKKENPEAESKEIVITGFGENGEPNEGEIIVKDKKGNVIKRVSIVRLGNKRIKFVTQFGKQGKIKELANVIIIVDKIEEVKDNEKGIIQEKGYLGNNALYEKETYQEPKKKKVLGFGEVEGIKSLFKIFNPRKIRGQQQLEMVEIGLNENNEIIIQIDYLKPLIQEAGMSSPLKEVRYVVTYQGKEYWFSSEGELINTVTLQ